MSVKPRTNFILDTIILVLFVVVLVSGVLLWQVYPEGQSRHQGRRAEVTPTETVMGLDRSDMRAVHDWAGVLMGVLVGVHLVFHWKWIVCQMKRLFRIGQARQVTQHKDLRV